MTIYSAIDNLPPQGAFGTPLGWGSPATSSVVGAVVLFRSYLIILHPYYPDGFYDGTLPDISATLVGGSDDPAQMALNNSANQAASNAAASKAIAQANAVLAK
jgi:hypothetical protein